MQVEGYKMGEGRARLRPIILERKNMAQASGFVEVVTAKTETKAGKRLRSPLYSFKIDNDWYGCGFDNPGIEKGDTVEFEFSEGDYGKECNVSTIKKTTSAPVNSNSNAKSVSVSGDRQVSIVYQSQHRDALSAVQFMVEQGIVKLPSKQAEKYDVFLGLVKEITTQWTVQALDPDLSEQEEDAPVLEDDE